MAEGKLLEYVFGAIVMGIGWWNKVLHSRLRDVEREKLSADTFNRAMERRDKETDTVVAEIRKMGEKTEHLAERTHTRIDALSVEVAKVAARAELDRHQRRVDRG